MRARPLLDLRLWLQQPMPLLQDALLLDPHVLLANACAGNSEGHLRQYAVEDYYGGSLSKHVDASCRMPSYRYC
jgi:hypothetical protein